MLKELFDDLMGLAFLLVTLKQRQSAKDFQELVRFESSFHVISIPFCLTSLTFEGNARLPEHFVSLGAAII